MEGARDLTPVPAITFTEVMMRQSGSFVSAAHHPCRGRHADLVRLATGDQHDPGQPQVGRERPTAGGAKAPVFWPARAARGAALALGEAPNLVQDVSRKVLNAPQRRLEQIVQLDEKQAAAILKQWIRQEEST